MERERLRQLVEAILATSRAPVPPATVADAVDEESVDIETVVEVLETLRQELADRDGGLRLEQVARGWRLVTLPELDPYLRSFHGLDARQRLSQAALEVLAVVAYRQPMTVPEINFIRGVSSAGVVRGLCERGLLKVAGRKRVVGNPYLYRTTKAFLVHFGVDRPEDLPEPESLVDQEEGEIEPAN